ncbi:MAG: phospholipase D-like domain-containing protein, partial [Propionibacteriaceae bacterium]
MVSIYAVALLGVISSGPASVAEAAPAPGFKIQPGLIFNNPKGKKAKQLTIITQINKGIDNAPRGSNIYMAQYLFDIDSVANKLIAAHRRGVNVKVLIDDGTPTKQSRRVKAALGTNKKARSYVTTCKRSCMANVASVMHAKFYLFSQTGASKLVSMVSSANPYTGNTFTSWNNNHTIVGDRAIYNSLVKYFNDMILDRNNTRYYRTTQSGKYKLYLFPRAPQPGVQTVIPIDVLNHVACTGVAKGYGSKGKTVIRIAMWGWTGGRRDLANQLWAMHNRGCKVEVIINSGRTNSGVMKQLLKKSKKYGRMKVYDAWQDFNKNGLPGLYIHHKTFMINGRWFGHPNTKVTYTGSQNFSAPATTVNNDIVMRIIDNGTYNAYGKNLDYIRKKYTRKLNSVPKVYTRSLSVKAMDAKIDALEEGRITEKEFAKSIGTSKVKSKGKTELE